MADHRHLAYCAVAADAGAVRGHSVPKASGRGCAPAVAQVPLLEKPADAQGPRRRSPRRRPTGTIFSITKLTWRRGQQPTTTRAAHVCRSGGHSPSSGRGRAFGKSAQTLSALKGGADGPSYHSVNCSGRSLGPAGVPYSEARVLMGLCLLRKPAQCVAAGGCWRRGSQCPA